MTKLRRPAEPSREFLEVESIVAEVSKKLEPRLNRVLEAASRSGEERRRNLDGITDPALRRSAAKK